MTVAIANVRTIFLKFIFYFCHYSVMIVQGKDEVLFQKDKGRREMPSLKLKSTIAKVTKDFKKVTAETDFMKFLTVKSRS